jgi:hypothetical protein
LRRLGATTKFVMQAVFWPVAGSVGERFRGVEFAASVFE